MDDFLAKPLKASELFATIERVLPPGSPAGPGPTARDRGYRLAELFRAEGPALLAAVRSAVAAADAASLVQAAHKLAGAVSHFERPEADAVARRLEELARSGDLAAIPTVLAELEGALRRLDESFAPVALK
jgi:two-component system sensor histidine kinase/response regulator